jgi:CheY-like chemotaxis protein
MNATRVFYVENHPEYMGALKCMLEAAGCEVMAATTGGQALRLLTDLHVDGVLLEYDLPDATGSAVRAEMKRIKPDISVLLFAGIGSQTAFLLRFLTRIFRTRNDQKMLSRIWTHRVDSVSEVGRTLALNTPSHCPRSYGVFVTKLEES